ncbi:phosphotransferase family protein [Paenarthrobacter sp. NPDC058040]|uniref:phosphotransferase family protein n=1 Tax=unclassified Paenarthrobacter TaxID=2634190 RepID=UPI0036D9E976
MNTIGPAHAASRIAARRGFRRVTLAGSGTEFLFFVASGHGRQEGYRVPRTPYFKTANNPGVSASDLQRQEMALAAWARTNGVPSAQPLDLIDQDGYPVLVLEVLDDDGSRLDSAAVGAVIATMHLLPPPGLAFVAQNGLPIGVRIAERLGHRYSALGQRTQLPPLPPVGRMADALESSLAPPGLVHLDVRRQNVRVQQGRPLSLFDWSNALPAAPELEIARIEEYAAIAAKGLDYRAFREGYAAAGGVVNETYAAWPLFRLDAAVMLAVVFDSVAPDPALRELFLGRVTSLLGQL